MSRKTPNKKPRQTAVRRRNREKAAVLVERLRQRYPDAACALESGGDPFRLLVMSILSAQCTDVRVNIVSKDLFAALPDAASMANAELSEIEHYVRSCGLYKTKAKNIRAASEQIVSRFGGEVPSSMEDLLSLPGVGRKIANLIRGDVFGLPAIVTDTHCIRLAGRFGFCPPDEKNPLKIERILVDAVAEEEQADFCHRLVWYGREVCSARNPSCRTCELRDLCDNPAVSAEKESL